MDALAVRVKDAVASGELAAATLTLELGAPRPGRAGGPAGPRRRNRTYPGAHPGPHAHTLSHTGSGTDAGPGTDAGCIPGCRFGGRILRRGDPGVYRHAGGGAEKQYQLYGGRGGSAGRDPVPEPAGGGPPDSHCPYPWTEAYQQAEGETYEESDPYRTLDTAYNVVRVGDALQEALSSWGLSVVHDRELYDYPSYAGSYTRSGASVEAWLAQYPDIALVIDLHRDAVGTEDVVYKTRAVLEGKTSAQVMLVMGTGENGLEHPNWRENLKLALAMQKAMDDKYPTLTRPINLAQERYNQHLTQGSLILEVGSSGNTLSEALCAVELFADAVAPLLLSLVEQPG